MAKSIEEVLNREIKSVKDLRNAIKEYQDSLIGVDAESQEFKDTTEMLRTAQDELTKVTRAGKDAVDADKTSIVGLEQEYKKLYNTYKLLDKDQRNSPWAREQANQMKMISEELNNLKKGVGNYKDNIGRYADSIMDAFKQMGGSVGNLVGPFKTATQGVDAFNKTLKANPVMAVVGLLMTLVNVIKQLSAGIKDNEESQMRLNQAMATFQPMIDAAKNAMDRFGQAIVSVVEFIAKAVDKFREAKATFTDFLGITKNAKEAVKEQQKTYKELAKSVDNLTKTKREYQKANAEDKAEVERLREEASETTNLAEKKQLLEEAKAKQAEIDNRNIEIAKEELRILEEQSALTANDAAANDALAAAIAKVSEAEAAAAANMRNFNKQISGASGGAASATKNYREEAKKLYEETIENAKDEVQKLTDKYEKEKKLLEKYHYDTTLLTKKYNKDIEKLYKEAAKNAAEKASKAYVEAAQRRIGEGEEFSALTEKLQDELDGVLLNVRQMERKKKEYDEFFKNFLSINFDDSGAIDTAKQFVSEINEILGTDIHFPPEITDKSMADFRDKLDNARYLFELAIKRMEATAQKADIEKSLNRALNGEMSPLEERINSLRSFDVNEENLRQEQLAQITRTELQMEKEKYRQMLEIENLSDEERMEARQNYYAVLEEMRQLDLDAETLQAERTAQVWEDAFGAFDNVANSINNIVNSYSQLMQAEVQSGKLTEKEAKKRRKTMENLAKVQLALTVATVAADTANGVMAIWKGFAQETANNAVTAAAAGVGAPAVKAALDAKSLASAILKTTGLGANAMAQVAAARGGYISTVNNLRDSESAGSAIASVATPSEVNPTPYTYTRTVQTFDEEQQLNRPIWVSVRDIDDAQRRVEVRDEESSF